MTLGEPYQSILAIVPKSERTGGSGDEWSCHLYMQRAAEMHGPYNKHYC